MALRRLQQPGSAPASPSAPPPAPAQATAVLEPPAQAAPPPASGNLPALSQAQLAAFKAFGGGAAATAAPLVNAPQHPYVVFFHEKVTDARDIAVKLPAVGVGDPVLKCDGQYYDARPFPFTILKDYQYWTSNDNQGAPIGWHTAGGGDRKEVVETLMLLLTPEPILTMTRLKTTKCPIAKKHREAIAECQTPQAIARDATLGAMAGSGFPPAFRLMSLFKVTPKTGKNYAVGGIVPQTTTAEQAAAIMAWYGSEDGQKEVAELTRLFDLRVAEIKAKAK